MSTYEINYSADRMILLQCSLKIGSTSFSHLYIYYVTLRVKIFFTTLKKKIVNDSFKSPFHHIFMVRTEVCNRFSPIHIIVFEMQYSDQFL